MPFKKGQIGNPNGRPARPEIEELRKALDKAKRLHKKSFLEAFVEKAYSDNNVAIALAKKILPDMTHNKNDEMVKIVTMPFIQDKDGNDVINNLGS